jgi:thiamine biosynthesis protein ThiI
VIDDVSELLVLRPLCTTDKQTIIDTARSIGTEEFSKHIPEFCAVISNHPTTKAKPQRIEDEEARFDFSKLDAAIASARFQLITEVVEDLGSGSAELKVAAAPDAGQVVIEIRHPSEIELSPMPDLADAPEVLEIPFYQLRAHFEHLDPDTQYLLYCDQGMMSRLHAAHLDDEGFVNVAVLDLRV